MLHSKVFLFLVLCQYNCIGADAENKNTERESWQSIKYHGIRPTDIDGRKAWRNPERGFRLEIAGGEIQPGSKYYPENKITCLPRAVQKQLRGNESNDQLWLKSFEYYSDEGLTLALAYIYLTDYHNKDIPQEKMDAIQKTFDGFRNNGLKVIPLFLYEYNTQCTFGPTLSGTLKGIERLGQLIRTNADIIAVMRAGFVGAYGEWHCSYNNIMDDHNALSQIAAKLLEVLPEDRMLCIRVPKYKRWALGRENSSEYEWLNEREAWSGSPKSRISHADDGFMASDNGKMMDGYAWPEPPYYASAGNPEFDMMTVESAYGAIDGEMFVMDLGGVIDGYAAAKRLRLHHYSSLSYFHGNNEMELYGVNNKTGYDGNNPPPEYNINRWKKTALNQKQLMADKMPVSDGYFEDSSGAPARRTQYEYIRDHLGYRLELQEASFPASITRQRHFSFKVKLINRGFATLYNPRPVYLAFVDSSNEVTHFEIANASPRTWQPYDPMDKSYKPLVHEFGCEIALFGKIKAGTYHIGLWLPDAYERLKMNSEFAVRFANRDVVWWTSDNRNYGINLLGKCAVN